MTVSLEGYDGNHLDRTEDLYLDQYVYRQADKADVLIASLRDVTESVTRTLPGFVAASIHKSTDGERIANYVQWKTIDDFQAMFADPRMRAHMAEVAALSVSVMPIAYTVVYVGEVPRQS